MTLGLVVREAKSVPVRCVKGDQSLQFVLASEVHRGHTWNYRRFFIRRFVWCFCHHGSKSSRHRD